MSAPTRIDRPARADNPPPFGRRKLRWWLAYRYLPVVTRRLGRTINDPKALPRAAREAGIRVPAFGLFLQLPDHLAPGLIRMWEPAWCVTPSKHPAAHRGLKRFKERERLTWTQARRLALVAGLRAAWCRRDHPRRVRIGRQWVKAADGTVAEVSLHLLPDLEVAFHHLRRETMKAAKELIAVDRAAPEQDALGEAGPLHPVLSTEDLAAEALEALEVPCESAWDDLLRAAPRHLEELLGDLEDGQRERLARLLELVEKTGDMTQAKKALAAEEGISANAVDGFLHRVKEAV